MSGSPSPRLIAFRKVVVVFSLLVLIFLSAKALFHEGFFRTIDDITTVRIIDLAAELKDGYRSNMPVRISSRLAHGYGYPLYLFYAPLVYYAGAGLMIFFNLSHIVATKAVYVFPLFIGPVFFYVAARQKLRILPALIGTSLYTFFPFRGWETYYRGGVGEAWVMALLPAVFSGIFLAQKQKKIGYPLMAIFLAAIILSHNLGGMAIFGFLCFYGGVFRLGWKYWVYLCLALGLSFFYWAPALAYLRLVQVNYSLQNIGSVLEFLRPLSFITGRFAYLPEEGYYSAHLFWFAVIGLVILAIQRKKKTDVGGIFWFGTAIFFLFLLTDLSRFIWQYTLPLSRFIQFPWRLMIIVSFALPYALACLANTLFHRKAVLGGLIALVVFLAWTYRASFRPIEYSYFYEYRAEDSGPCSTSWGEEYLPLWVEQCATHPAESAYLLANEEDEYQLQVFPTIHKNWVFRARYHGPANTLYLTTYYFPGWKASINDKPAGVVFGGHKQGLVELSLPPGELDINLWYAKTWIIVLSETVSAGCFILLLMSVWLAKRGK